jgi:hypothetical protein
MVIATSGRCLTKGEITMGVDIQLDSILLPWLDRYEFKSDPAGTADEVIAQLNDFYRDYESSGGYFRSGYNESDALWAMGLSWEDDVFPLRDAERKLPIAAARDLLAKIEARPLTPERCTEHIRANLTSGERRYQGRKSVQQMLDEMKAQVTGCELAEPEYDIEEFMPWRNRKRDTLMAILRRSIELNEPLSVS